MRKIKLLVYRVNKHYSLSDFTISKSEYLHFPDAVYKPTIYQGFLNDDYFEIVDDPDAAEFILFPLDLYSIIYRCGIYGDYKSFFNINDPDGHKKILSLLYKLPYFATHQEKHLLFNGHDWDGPYNVRCIVAGPSLSTYSGVRHITLPFLIDDLRYGLDRTDIKYFTNFVGYYSSHPLRGKLAQSLVSYLECNTDLPIYVRFNGTFHPQLACEERIKRRNEFLKAMAASLTTLCPRGTGFNSARFFETMCMGRVPILISDGCELPSAGEIDWDSLILRIDEGEIDNIGSILRKFSTKFDAHQLARMGIKNRIVWETYMQPSIIPKLYHTALSRFLEEAEKKNIPNDNVNQLSQGMHY
ncbi:MAG: exostosin domain-containing protein [Syntrophobacteraceae bacterium]